MYLIENPDFKVILQFAIKKDKRIVYDLLMSPEIIDLMFNEQHPAPSFEEFNNDEPDSLFTGHPGIDGSYLLIKADNRVIGSISYALSEGTEKCAELDIFIASKKDTGKGYGIEALKLVMNFVRSHHRINTFIIRPWCKNTHAIKAYKKCGFREFDSEYITHFYSREAVNRYGEGDYGLDETLNLVYRIKE
ncbi:GNAT family N-acetyltransferase [Haloplasma contractile]|uniref:Phospholipiddiacylglycerol acyltransferase protein n=1 Tax=Haloplasma contractile SSD-17B TaxID=1033810 RepID=F7Q0Y9_9MOLU|nr:GNAT family N-acetyltransferase [Haloplasma contractile]ERJ11339.1 phospholipiddiacylglycerol acyltransferase protein [Haloplasma contractile SSD-17B]